MEVDLNTASRQFLRDAGLTDNEVRRIKKFIRDNAVFHSKTELKDHCNFSSQRYNEVQDKLTARRLQCSPYTQEVQTRKYRKDNEVKADWDVGHIIAHANGGANHPANYVPMARDYNRALQDRHDGVIFAHLSDERLREAVRASRVQSGCKLTFSEAKRRAQKVLKILDIREATLLVKGFDKIDGGYDETEGSMETRLCDADYCEMLVREWDEDCPKQSPKRYWNSCLSIVLCICCLLLIIYFLYAHSYHFLSLSNFLFCNSSWL